MRMGECLRAGRGGLLTAAAAAVLLLAAPAAGQGLEFHDNGWIQAWLLLGPYNQLGGAAPGEDQILRDYLTDGAGITEFDWIPIADDEVDTQFGAEAASEGYTGGFFFENFDIPTTQAHWDEDDTVDLNALANDDEFSPCCVSGAPNDVMAYAITYINNPGDEPIDATIELASDDSIQVSLGPCAIFVHNGGRGPGGAETVQDRVPVTLEPGPQRLLVKVFEGGGQWGFRLRFVDELGTPLTDASDPPIEVSLEPDDFGLTDLGEASCLHAVVTSDLECGGEAPLDVVLSGADSVSRAAITGYEWDFGDGTTDTGEEVEHTYDDAGFYQVTLTVTDETGATSTAHTTVIVKGEFICEPPPDAPEATLTWAFAFGSTDFTCPTYNDPDTEYIKVAQNILGPIGLLYDEDRGWGYEATRGTGVTYFDYGPMDDSPNNRGDYGASDNTCPEELYDQFIGAKNFASTCTAAPCPFVPGTDSREGIHFRIDVPNGTYRFVAAFGDSDNVHAHFIMVENGGEGEEIDEDNSVVLVRDFDQAQWCIGETEPTERGEGVYPRVGFDCKIPPPGDGMFPDPQFVNMDEEGNPTFGPPNSPTLEVTEGYIRLHQLQGVSNDGVGGPRDPNGGDAVVFEVWKIEGPVVVENQFKRGEVSGDGALTIGDPIQVLNYMFGGGTAPACMDAADIDDNGSLTIGDPITLLNYMFGDGAPPADPGPDTCGTDPTGDDPWTECDYPACP